MESNAIFMLCREVNKLCQRREREAAAATPKLLHDGEGKSTMEIGLAFE